MSGHVGNLSDTQAALLAEVNAAELIRGREGYKEFGIIFLMTIIKLVSKSYTS